jgi:hypothetical protein
MPRLVRCEPDCTASLDGFLARLRETVAWCAPRVDLTNPRGCLRDDHLRPRSLERSYFDAVRHVASWRAAKLGQSRHFPHPPLAGGRLLAYFPDAELCDGAAEIESGGYFDVFNTPPWDTWLAFAADNDDPGDSYANYLIAWVPPAFLEAASRGIDVNPEQCIMWIEDSGTALAEHLAEHL